MPGHLEAYERLGVLGAGSFGKVYKVRCKEDKKVYVLKRVSLTNASEEERDAALMEAELLGKLRHPHIVPYRECFWDEDEMDLCLVMAHCEGGDLHGFIKQHRKAGIEIDETQAWSWMVQMLLALQYLHGKRILHRDVKSQNIFITENKVMIGDFGLSKQLEASFDMAKTPIGTPFYMSPEIMEGKPYSYKGDVWALGCVMYELLTQKPAFGADCFPRVAIKVIRGTYEPITDHYSEGLRAVVTAMLARSVDERPDMTQLLLHPPIQDSAVKYLKELEGDENRKGWDTWRRGCPVGEDKTELQTAMRAARAEAQAMMDAEEALERDRAALAAAPAGAPSPASTVSGRGAGAPSPASTLNGGAGGSADSRGSSGGPPAPAMVWASVGPGGSPINGGGGAGGGEAGGGSEEELQEGKAALEACWGTSARSTELGQTLFQARGRGGARGVAGGADEGSDGSEFAELKALASQLREANEGPRPGSAPALKDGRVHARLALVAEGGSEGGGSSGQGGGGEVSLTGIVPGPGGIAAPMPGGESPLVGGSPAGTPSGTIDLRSSMGGREKRARRLRAEIMGVLGEPTFHKLRDFLKERESLYADEDDMALQIELAEIIDEENLRFWPLMDELLLYESQGIDTVGA